MARSGHSLPAAERVGPPCLPVAGPRQEEPEKRRGQPRSCQHDSAPLRPPGHRVPSSSPCHVRPVSSLLQPPVGQAIGSSTRGRCLAQPLPKMTSLMGLSREASRELDFSRKGFQGSRPATLPTPHPHPRKLNWRQEWSRSTASDSGQEGSLGRHWTRKNRKGCSAEAGANPEAVYCLKLLDLGRKLQIPTVLNDYEETLMRGPIAVAGVGKPPQMSNNK